MTGSDAALTVFTNGQETPTMRGNVLPSVMGNEVSGTFALTYRGWSTPPIDFDASTTEMVVRLQSLPNIGQVSVSRIGPTPWKGTTPSTPSP